MFWFEKGLISIACFIPYHKTENMDMEMTSGCLFHYR